MKKFTIHSDKKHNGMIFISSAFFLFVLIAFLKALTALSTANLAEQEKVLHHAVSQSITECYALEGCYPDDLSYLEEHYGLTYDSKQFYIDYQYIGSNLRPDVTIIRRKTS